MSDALERIKDAREALDAMNDLARMACSVNPIGPRRVLEGLIAEHEALLKRVDRMESVGKLIVDGAIPATASGHTCFVPRYQIDQLKASIDAVRILAEPGEVGCG